ncbi:DDRGK domain-containing protein 1 [Linum perenne]
MEELFVAILSMLLVVGLIPLYIWKRRQDSRSPDVQQEEPQRETVVRATGASRTRMRRRPAAGASSSRVAAEMAEDNVDESDDEGEVDDATGKSSKKRDKKRQEREAQRQANEAARESRSSKQDYYAEMRRKKDEEHEAKERMLEEEAKARKAKEEEAAALEFQKWKGEFSVDDEGTMENEAEDGNQSLLSGFVDYIKKQKCVPLEDLAAEFKMRTQDGYQV